MSIVFIERNDNKVLWSYGNYQYEIEDRVSGELVNFESNIEEALIRLECNTELWELK